MYITWAYERTSSLWIYSDNLLKELKKCKEYNIIDKRRAVVNWSVFYQLKKYLQHLIKIYKEIKNSDNNIVIDTNNVCWIPPLLIWKNKIKRILIVHDLFYYDKDFYNNKKWLVKYVLYYYYKTIHKYLFKLTFKKIDVIVAISEATKKDIINKFWYRFSDKTKVIYNWMDIDSFKPARNKDAKKRKYILYVWSELERKNLKNIIAAFWIIHKKYPDLKLFKAPNEKNQENRNKTLKYIEDNYLKEWKDVILIKEYLSLEKLVELYQQAEIFCFPSLKEWFWFPIIEAQACWTPVITTNYEPMSELVPYKDMLVNPNNPADIADKMIEILEDKKLKEKLVKEWFKFVKRFSRKNTAKSFINILEAL